MEETPFPLDMKEMEADAFLASSSRRLATGRKTASVSSRRRISCPVQMVLICYI
jgi:hypothetical protein